VVDRPLLARQVATVRDAVARIRSVLPPSIYHAASSPDLDDLEAFCAALALKLR
jgi:hypothetical protein